MIPLLKATILLIISPSRSNTDRGFVGKFNDTYSIRGTRSITRTFNCSQPLTSEKQICLIHSCSIVNTKFYSMIHGKACKPCCELYYAVVNSKTFRQIFFCRFYLMPARMVSTFFFPFLLGFETGELFGLSYVYDELFNLKPELRKGEGVLYSRL